VVVSTVATLFHVAKGRSGKVITTLLGDTFSGLVSSDRLKSYRALPPERRQICWSHLRRNLLAFYERDGPLGTWAADMLAQLDVMFGLWHTFRDGRIDRAMLVASMQPVQATICAILERGRRRYDQAQGLSDELLNLWPALWTFVTVEGVEPTGYPLGECGRTGVASGGVVAPGTLWVPVLAPRARQAIPSPSAF
jgi:transposase